MKKEFKNISMILCLGLLTVFMSSCGNDGNSSLSEIENFPVVSKVEQNSEISYQYDEVSEKFDESYKKLKEFSEKMRSIAIIVGLNYLHFIKHFYIQLQKF